MSTTATIRADYVQLALVARKAVSATRWAALSTGHHTHACGARYGRYSLAVPSLMLPMGNHGLIAVAERVRVLHGRAEVQRLFGAGIRAIRRDGEFWKVRS